MKVDVRARNGTWSFECAAGEKILHAALRSGIELPYECATGTCGTCKATLVSGRHESHWGDAPGHKYVKAEGEFLTCQSIAHEDCALEVSMIKAVEEGTPPPRALGGVLRARRRLTHDVIAFDVHLDQPIDFEAGQFALLTVPGVAGARAYSMVNFDRPAACLSFVVKQKPRGAVSGWLLGDDVEGSRLTVFAPLGHATFRPGLTRHLVMIAGGSGIAGMMSILSRASGEGHFSDRDGHVFFGVRGERDCFFLDELDALHVRHLAGLTITVALSDVEEVPASLAAAHPGLAFATGFVHAVAGERLKGCFADVRAYVAGPPPMVDATLRLLLREARLRPDDIRYDKFS